MTASEPTIVATSGGMRPGRRSALELAPLLLHAVELAGVGARAPRLCYVGTAGGDQRAALAEVVEAGRSAGIATDYLTLFPMPNVSDPESFLLEHDVVWVGGGSVANLLALWRLHGLDEAMRKCWRSGVVLGGVSAGSICWHFGGTTDSFGPELEPVVNGLALLPYGNGVHYDSEERRRPLLQRLVAEGTLPESYATDDGVGLVYRGTELAEAVSEVRGKGAYHVVAEAGEVLEERVEPRLLPGAA